MSTENGDSGSSEETARNHEGEGLASILSAPHDRGILKDRVVAIPRTGLRMLVWWSLTADGLNRARRALEDPECAQLILRLHHESEDGQRSFEDLMLQRWFGHRWLTELEEGARISVSVGYRQSGGFVQIVGAAPATIPSTGFRKAPVRTSTTRYIEGKLSVEAMEDGLPWGPLIEGAHSAAAGLHPEEILWGIHESQRGGRV